MTYRMSTQYEKIRKLKALGWSPNKHEAAAALAKAKALEDRAARFNAKAIAYAIGQLLEARGAEGGRLALQGSHRAHSG
jgi:hypothetical protein